MKYALVNPNWSFQGSIYFGCREPHLPLEYGYAQALLEREGHEALIVDGQLDNLARDEIRAMVTVGPVPEIDGAHKVPAHVRAAIRRGLDPEPQKRFPALEPLLDELARDPSARRRKWDAVGGVVVALGASIAIPLVMQENREPPAMCGGADEQIGSAWGPARRTAMQQAFAATKAPFADGAFQAAARTLDRYAAETAGARQ